MASPDRNETIAVNANIQALRAIAAYGVVIHHIIFSCDHYIGVGRAPMSINIGATGVEIQPIFRGFLRHDLFKTDCLEWSRVNGC